MAKLYALFTAALFAGLTLAADPAPDPAAASPGHMPPGCPMMKQAPDQPGHHMMEGKGMMAGRGMCRPCPMGMGNGACRRAFCGPMGCFLPRCSACCVLTVLAVILLINLLLTVLVARDMSSQGRMNGLWIPLVLIAGIPVTALYALFRIGDNLKALEEKRV